MLVAFGACNPKKYKLTDLGPAGEAGSAGVAGGAGVAGAEAGGAGAGGKTTARGGSGGSTRTSSTKASAGGQTGTEPTSANGGTSTGGTQPMTSAMGGAQAGGTSATSTATAPCGLIPNPTDDRTKRRLLLRDEAVSKLAFVDIGNAANYWEATLDREANAVGPQGRDLQLIGNCRILVPTDLGYDEYDLRTHARVNAVTAYPGTLSAQRLRNKNTLLVGVGTSAAPWQGKVGIVLLQLDAAGAIIPDKTLVYPGTYARLVRETQQGTFLIANNQRVIEGESALNSPADGYNHLLPTVFNVATPTLTQPHTWLGLRVATAVAGVYETVVASGYGASLLVFQSDGTLRKTITGGSASIPGGASAVNPNFFAGFQLLGNGNYLVSNWSGHSGASRKFTDGIPVLEYNPAGALVWSWGDPAYGDRLLGLQAAIVLDGLDPMKLHVEGPSGKLVPVD